MSDPIVMARATSGPPKKPSPLAAVWTGMEALARRLLALEQRPLARDGRDGAPGRDGKDGAVGPRGEIGPRGEPGPAGKDGRDGAPGKDGVSIKAATVIEGRLVLKLTDAREIDCGVVQGAPGKDGRDGRDAVMPASGAELTDAEFARRISAALGREPKLSR
jgi:hypothetical protein